MKAPKNFQLLALLFSIFISQNAIAQPLPFTPLMTEPLPPTLAGRIYIFTMDDADIFYQYQQKLPSVVNYFTGHSEQEIVDFYITKYGEPESKEIKRGRLVLYFLVKDNYVRVIISTQNKKRQVDVLMT